MNFSSKIKKELISHKISNTCCKIALLSGFLRTSGTVETRNGLLGFSLIGEVEVLKFFEEIIFSLYGTRPQIIAEKSQSARCKLELMNEVAFKILQDCGIVKLDGQTFSLQLSMDESVIDNSCCKISFITGAFLGSGSVTVPSMENYSSTGYHLECVFSKYATATEFSELLSSFDFLPKLIKRKDFFVVYMKNAEAINDFITLINATKSSLEFTDLTIRKNIKNKTNRALNCEMSNLSKQINASIKDIESIDIIDQTVGLSNLPKSLLVVADARRKFSDMTLLELSNKLDISKSCLSHRLRRLNEIAKSFKD